MNIKTANPNYFIVRVEKELQKATKEGLGIIKRAAPFTFGKGGTQCGEIIAIGKLAHLIIPQAKVGGNLLFSWKVEYAGVGTERPNMNLIEEDENYNYYSITISEFKKRDNDCYGYFDNEIFVTHPSFVIVHSKEKESNKLSETASGIYFYQNWTMSEDEIMQKIKFNQDHIYSLSVTCASLFQQRESEAYPVKLYMQKLEQENKELSELLHGKEKFEEYKVAFCNPDLQGLQNGEKIFAHNIFFLEPIEINNRKYFIGKHKHIGIAC